jgi:hypothetical protein
MSLDDEYQILKLFMILSYWNIIMLKGFQGK